MKSEKYMARDLGLRICRVAFASACIASLSLSLPGHSLAVSEYSDNAVFGRRYSLVGSLELSYERYWSQGGAGNNSATADFRQLLLLDHRGFVADPNLVTYTLSGFVTHDSGKGTENSTLTGESLGVTLFHSLPESWKKNEDYIPHPVWLRFSHDAGPSYESTNYGFSFVHSVTPKERYLVTEKAAKPEGADADLYEDAPDRTSKIVEKERPFPIPRTFFDYDHDEEKTGDARTLKDTVNLRSILTGKIYDYRFLFEHQNESASSAVNKNTVQLEPNYRFYDEETRRRIDIKNLLRFEDYNQSQGIELGSNLNWSRPIGKNEASATAALGYTGSSSARLTEADYSAAASGSYRQYLSPRLTNNTSLLANIRKRISVDSSAAFERSTTVDDHNLLLSDGVSADISRLYNGAASAYLGNGAQGMAYGGSATVFTKTRIITSLSYSYSLSAPQLQTSTDLAQQNSIAAPTQVLTGRISKHDVALNATGPLLNNLSFQSRAEITLSEAPITGGRSREQTENLSGNFLWRLPKTDLTLGGNFSQSKIKDTQTSDLTSTSLFATLTRALPNRMLFNFYSTWTKTTSTGVSDTDTTRLELRPKLRWTRGLTSVDTEYSYTRSVGGGDQFVDQRFFARLVRRFSAFF